MKILVTGGRNFSDHALLNATLDRIDAEYGIDCVVHGGATGADALAGAWAMSRRGKREIVYPADWRQHSRSAGPIRNQAMLDEERPDLVVAFAGGKGTADMVRRARTAGVKVEEVG